MKYPRSNCRLARNLVDVLAVALRPMLQGEITASHKRVEADHRPKLFFAT